MSPTATMEREPATGRRKIRIEKPEISVYPGSVQKSAANSPALPEFYKFLIFLSFLFSTAAFYLLLSAL